MTAQPGYAGDLSPQEAFDLLQSNPASVLIDCRTTPEWQFVGVPDLSGLGRDAEFISWQVYPEMSVQTDFAQQVYGRGIDTERTILLLCRSGVRSRSAALALTQAGYKQAYNVREGFEGDLDSKAHRGQSGGWKKVGLPWKQQ